MNSTTKQPHHKILFLCGARPDYTRNEFWLDRLRRQENADFIYSRADSYPARLASVITRFVFRNNKRGYGAVVIGFLAQPLIPFVRLFYKKTIVADFFISVYDTLCLDRRKISPGSILGKIIFRAEKWTTRMADYIITDTEADKDFYSGLFAVSPSRVKVVYVLANRKIFYPRENSECANAGGGFRVFFYANCQRLHGAEIILKAAGLLAREHIGFTLIGPFEKTYGALIKKNDLSHARFIDRVPYEKLPEYIAESDLCLGGHFSDTAKAKRVIAGKTFQFAAMKKAVILGDNQANREIFADKKNCLMVRMNHARALADGIISLRDDPELRNKIALQAYATVIELEKKTRDINLYEI